MKRQSKSGLPSTSGRSEWLGAKDPRARRDARGAMPDLVFEDPFVIREGRYALSYGGGLGIQGGSLVPLLTPPLYPTPGSPKHITLNMEGGQDGSLGTIDLPNGQKALAARPTLSQVRNNANLPGRTLQDIVLRSNARANDVEVEIATLERSRRVRAAVLRRSSGTETRGLAAARIVSRGFR